MDMQVCGVWSCALLLNSREASTLASRLSMSSRLSRALGTDVHQGYPTQRPQSIVWEMLSSSLKEMALHNLLIHATLGRDFLRVCFR